MDNLVALKDTFSENLRAMLRERGMTQSELAKRMDCTPGYVSHLLTGHRTPQLDTLEKIARVLQCKPSDLISEKVC